MHNDEYYHETMIILHKTQIIWTFAPYTCLLIITKYNITDKLGMQQFHIQCVSFLFYTPLCPHFSCFL